MFALKTITKSIPFKNNALKQIPCTYAASTKRFGTVRQKSTQSKVDLPNEKEDFIRMIFDDNALWMNLTKTARHSQMPVGLFENSHFTSVQGIDFAAQQAIQRAQIIVERICNAPHNGQEEMSRIVKNLDRLSDTLCSVIDIAEFVRNAHPDEHIMEAANKAYGDLCSYMNTLNTDTRIHKVCHSLIQFMTHFSQFSFRFYLKYCLTNQLLRNSVQTNMLQPLFF